MHCATSSRTRPLPGELQGQRAGKFQRRRQQHGRGGRFPQQRFDHGRIGATRAQLLPRRTEAHPVTAQRLGFEQESAQLAGSSGAAAFASH